MFYCRSVTREASKEKTSIHIDENLEKGTADYKQGAQCSSCALLETINKLNAELETLREEVTETNNLKMRHFRLEFAAKVLAQKLYRTRKLMKANENVLNETKDWLSSANEHQERETERLRAVEEEAATSKTDCATIKARLDKINFREQLSSAESLLALRSDLEVVTAERDGLKECINVLNQTVECFSTKNEYQKQEIERLRDTENEADKLKTECETIKGSADKLKIEHGRLQFSSREQSSSAESLLALRIDLAKVSAEREVLMANNEVITTENSTLRQQVEEMRGAEGMKDRIKVLKESTDSLSSENEALKPKTRYEEVTAMQTSM